MISSAAQHFTVEQLVQIDAGDAGLAAQDQAALVGAAALGDHRIRQTEKAVLPDGLELVEIGTHHIGFHCKLGGRSKKDDLDDVIVLPDLLGGGNAVFGRLFPFGGYGSRIGYNNKYADRKSVV